MQGKVVLEKVPLERLQEGIIPPDLLQLEQRPMPIIHQQVFTSSPSAHAQRGLRYCWIMSMSLCLFTFSATTCNETTKVIPTGPALQWLDFKIFLFQKLWFENQVKTPIAQPDPLALRSLVTPEVTIESEYGGTARHMHVYR